MRTLEGRDHADGRLPVVLRMHKLRRAAAPEGWRLLRILFVWIGPLPAGTD